MKQSRYETGNKPFSPLTDKADTNRNFCIQVPFKNSDSLNLSCDSTRS